MDISDLNVFKMVLKLNLAPLDRQGLMIVVTDVSAPTSNEDIC